MATEKQLQAIIFDFDETLADSLPIRVSAMRAAISEVLGLHLTPAETLEVIRSGSNLESQAGLLSKGDGVVAERLTETYRRCTTNQTAPR